MSRGGRLGFMNINTRTYQAQKTSPFFGSSVEKRSVSSVDLVGEGGELMVDSVSTSGVPGTDATERVRTEKCKINFLIEQ